MLLAGKIDPTYPDTISESQLLTWQAEGLIEWLGLAEQNERNPQGCEHCLSAFTRTRRYSARIA